MAVELWGGDRLALFLLAQAWYLRLVFGSAPRALLTTIAALAAVSAAALACPALVASLGVVVLLAGLVTVEHLKKTDQAEAGASTTLTQRAAEPR